ncbi:MAG: hypothetical protein WBF47_06140, partial [Xanthobacteraceae bacterium]
LSAPSARALSEVFLSPETVAKIERFIFINRPYVPQWTDFTLSAADDLMGTWRGGLKAISRPAL